MKFQTGYAVANVDETRTGVLLDYRITIFKCCQEDHTGLLRNFMIFAFLQVVIVCVARFLFVKALITTVQHSRNVGWYLFPFFTHSLNGSLKSKGIPQLKRTKFPVEAPLHGIVDLKDIVGDLRNSSGRIEQQLTCCFP